MSVSVLPQCTIGARALLTVVPKVQQGEALEQVLPIRDEARVPAACWAGRPVDQLVPTKKPA
ncbi:MAG TPA: hypothetical protein VHM70_11740 [Polyangiaceae bacterium]|nr:hypothetical protein [Polyangiaceae bacterium]